MQNQRYTASGDLIWTRLPNGEGAWLKPSSDAGEPDDALFVVTDKGRRALAEANLFGHPWPTCAEVARECDGSSLLG